MSTGARLPLADADKVAEALFRLWGLNPASAFVVGSVRRRKPDVGDLELVAPVEPKGCDVLHDRIKATLQSDVAGQLFTEPSPSSQPIGRAIKGLKPGFLSCSLLVEPYPDVRIPVQIYRYTPENLGWILIMRTGPEEFGKWFLREWKKHWRIPGGDGGKPASVDGHLVDHIGRVVPVRTEAEAFQRCGMPRFIPPEQRAVVLAQVTIARAMSGS